MGYCGVGSLVQWSATRCSEGSNATGQTSNDADLPRRHGRKTFVLVKSICSMSGIPCVTKPSRNECFLYVQIARNPRTSRQRLFLIEAVRMSSRALGRADHFLRTCGARTKLFAMEISPTLARSRHALAAGIATVGQAADGHN